MSSVPILQAAYAAFANNDPSPLFNAMAPDIQWHQAQGNPLADRNPYIGPQSVGEGVFGRLLAAIDSFTAVPDRFVDGGDDVIVLGRYGGTMKHNGEAGRALLPCLPLRGRPDRLVPAVHRLGAVGSADAVAPECRQQSFQRAQSDLQTAVRFIVNRTPGLGRS